MPTTPYDDKFYSARKSNVEEASYVVIEYLNALLPEFNSVIDIGCGDGAWLARWKEFGKAVVGVDGNYLDDSMLLVPRENYVRSDLAVEFPVFNNRFDICMSIEVAEHLCADRANSFIDYLCNLSDIVIFSAAIPKQGGVMHVNEQWQGYWAKKFLNNMYVPLDIVRPYLYENSLVALYAQNMIIYINRNAEDSIKSICENFYSKFNINVLSFVHTAFMPDIITRMYNKKDVYKSTSTWRFVELLCKRLFGKI